MAKGLNTIKLQSLGIPIASSLSFAGSRTLILVREYRGLDSGAAKRRKGSLKTYASRRRHASSAIDGSPSKRRRFSSPRPTKSVDLVSDSESLKDGPSNFLRPPTPVRAVLSRIQNEIGNVQVSINHLTDCLTSETKELRGTAETGFANITSAFDAPKD
ncbi:uncharacterized protein CIMG_05550 [Coccidioides immitis RS]|uniref:Uncharacterized protein n=4 Tax=Coccidioides immitis TaxID=5501 RepID=J3KFU2_COCIM|nr:uncharacterized protein CIMG_05550 [Coccidioides immitis RS]KMP05687.1 hypothetical protein CIRG_05368 [Coccidioides immitis RMSCC 2394]KMU74420.1 hypothetical protein CISG_04491 [Coccidioides immitis RMSCC 3703]KMU86917.1 hypothetical protein CIHG_04856 [Coccidioides immitis H538.4]TPX21957.1 hypothetical protein DIZ76_015922 [Coccidioides immitis]EAS34526.3 hypothetical protein CIMG_05550 [Coccidioides immitis RS]